MQKSISLGSILVLIVAGFLFNSCGSKSSGKSSATGWSYSDKNMGNFHVSKIKYPKAGPGLVFVQGGSFVMGAKDEDVMRDWNNLPRKVTVPSFFIDETEVANVHYREYIYWIENTFSNDTAIMAKVLPDTLVWREELAYNEPYVEYYFRYPSYNFYPVVGVNWQQAHDFCIWRTDRVNELALLKKGFLKKDAIAAGLFGALVTEDSFDRLGDVIAIPNGDLVLIEPDKEKQQLAMVGHHGGLTSAELEIPLYYGSAS
jgi:gliding motility-associated lipoprotein GldJ